MSAQHVVIFMILLWETLIPGLTQVHLLSNCRMTGFALYVVPRNQCSWRRVLDIKNKVLRNKKTYRIHSLDKKHINRRDGKFI